MRMFGNRKFALLLGLSAVNWGTHASAQHVPAKASVKPCARAVLEGQVQAGQSYEHVFRPGLSFKLEAIASGWIVRVLPLGKAREPHDYAELATPPYQSVTPLAISTDFSFRSQDAVGWNPRRFRYASSSEVFARMQRDYDPAMNGDVTASAELAALAAAQPEAELTILDAHLAPGANDQVPMAAAVASHLATTPHEVDQGQGTLPLGRIMALRFRVAFDLPKSEPPVADVMIDLRNCAAHPTMKDGQASYGLHLGR